MHELLGKEVNNSASNSANDPGVVAWKSGMDLNNTKRVFIERPRVPELDLEVICEKTTLRPGIGLGSPTRTSRDGNQCGRSGNAGVSCTSGVACTCRIGCVRRGG